jgi:hypothetical protein
MSVISIDATQLFKAAPRVGELYLTLLRAGKAVGALDSAGLPPALAGRAESVLSSVSRKLGDAANALDGTADELLRRAGLAELADQLSTLALATEGPGMTLGFIDAARVAGTYGVPANVAGIASKIGWGVGSAGLALSVGVPTAHDLGNPYLDDDRRVSNAVARSITGGGVIIAGGIIIGMASGVLLPVAVAAAAGLAFSVLDKKLGITEGLADGIDWATDQTSAASSAIAHGAGKAGTAIADGAGKAGTAIADGAGKAGHAIADGAGKAGNAIADGAGKAGGAIADGAGKAGGAIADGAGKAGGAIKDGVGDVIGGIF